MPVAAVRPLGIEAIISGSTTATTRNVVRVNANHLTILLNICDNVVDSNLGSGTSCGRNCDYRHCRLLCGSYALQGAYISELRVVDDDTDSLCGIHGRTAADSYKVISAALLERCNAGLNVFDGGVRLDIIVNLVSKTVFIQNVEYLLGNAELDEVGVGAYECLLECLCSSLLQAMLRLPLRHDKMSRSVQICLP